VIAEFAFAWFPFWRLPLGLEGPLRDGLVLATLAVAAVGIWSARAGISKLLFFLFGGTVILLGIVALWRGVILPKAVLQASLPLYLLVGLGLMSWHQRALRVGLLVLVGLSVVGLARQYAMGSQEDWRGAVSYLAREGHTYDLILVDAGAGLMPLNYYFEQEGIVRQTAGLPFRFWADTPPPLTADDFQQAESLIQGKADFWLLIFRNGFPDRDGQMLPYLSSHYALVDSQTLTKIRLYRFVNSPSA
jgi:hypothetical protein